MKVEESVDIGRTPGAVWAVVADPLNDLRWCRKVKSVEPSGDSTWKVMHKPVPMRPAMELTLERVDAEPPQRLTLRQEDDTSVFLVEYRLDDRESGTCFTQISEFEWKHLPRILHGTFARGVRRDIRNQLRALKRLLEG